MDGISGILILLALLILMQLLVMSATERAPGLASWRSVLMALALFWWFMPIVKKAYVDEVFYPNDSIVHEESAREIAYLINNHDWQGAWDYFGFGNEGYRFVLGGYYAFTNAPEVTTYAIHGLLGFWGLLSVLEMICVQTSARKVPFWVIALTMANPSALFWCTFNLKEGAMLWGLCMMLRAVLRFGEVQRREPLIWPALGILVAGFLRPHIVMAYLGALAIGVAVRQRKFSFAVLMVAGIFAAISMLRIMAPGFFETIRAAGITTTLSERFLDLSSDGGSAIRYRNGTPTPLLSGLILLNFRPFPWEAYDVATKAACAEIWCISLASIIGWYRLNQRWQLATSSFVMTLIVALIGLSLYFTYIYNMGLMVRQRVMVYPAILSLAVLPAVTIANRGFAALRPVPTKRPEPTPFNRQVRQAVPAYARPGRAFNSPRLGPVPPQSTRRRRRL